MAAAEGKQAARDSGPKYEKHVNQMQKMLEEASKQIEELQKREEELRRQKDKVAEELEEAMERLKAEEEARMEVSELKTNQEKELKTLTMQLVQAREVGVSCCWQSLLYCFIQMHQCEKKVFHTWDTPGPTR